SLKIEFPAPKPAASSSQQLCSMAYWLVSENCRKLLRNNNLRRVFAAGRFSGVCAHRDEPQISRPPSAHNAHNAATQNFDASEVAVISCVEIHCRRFFCAYARIGVRQTIAAVFSLVEARLPETK
ncbi:MAG TPA: hypothetical protein VFB80_06215, partial [Pirellulaceae bacterium]|nr:hypothetical protein [Pirellulaceae bacterium]